MVIGRFVGNLLWCSVEKRCESLNSNAKRGEKYILIMVCG